MQKARPDNSFGPIVATNSGVLGSNLSRRIFVIEVVHIQCPKLFKACSAAAAAAVLSDTVRYKVTMKVFRVSHLDLRASFCRDMNQTWVKSYT